MTDSSPDNPIAFFRGLEAGFLRILQVGEQAGGDALINALTQQAFDSFAGNVALQTEAMPKLACNKGCPTCCSLRVTATAPEILLMARYVRLIDALPHGKSLDLPSRIQAAHRKTAGLDEAAHFARHQPCPLIFEGVCIVHPVRSLACRGHAAFDAEVCRAVARGEDVDVPISEPHLMMRGLVQNSLQSALRRAGLAWGLYELCQGLALALADTACQQAWLAGGDSLGPAVADCDLAALGQSYDKLAP